MDTIRYNTLDLKTFNGYLILPKLIVKILGNIPKHNILSQLLTHLSPLVKCLPTFSASSLVIFFYYFSAWQLDSKQFSSFPQTVSPLWSCCPFSLKPVLQNILLLCRLKILSTFEILPLWSSAHIYLSKSLQLTFTTEREVIPENRTLIYSALFLYLLNLFVQAKSWLA